jgi:FMN phosphatase YigB (HAD superfamily)
LVEEQGLEISKCLMIGNDLHTDIGGAKNAGIDTLYMHTNLTPPDQRCADPAMQTAHHYEYEGYDWEELCEIICKL